MKWHKFSACSAVSALREGPSITDDPVSPNVRGRGEQIRAFGSDALQVIRLQVLIQVFVTRPLFDECEIGRVGLVLQKLVRDASQLDTCR